MNASFHARCIAIEKDEHCCLVGFADKEHDTRRYLQLQRAHTFDVQDRSLGLDSYYVERNDQRNSCYGEVEGCYLYADKLKLDFTAAGAASLSLDGPLNITFDASEETLNAVRNQLEIIFAGTQCLRDRTGG